MSIESRPTLYDVIATSYIMMAEELDTKSVGDIMAHFGCSRDVAVKAQSALHHTLVSLAKVVVDMAADELVAKARKELDRDDTN